MQYHSKYVTLKRFLTQKFIMKTIDSINFNGKKAIMRVDFNVPLNEKFEITDETRINAAIPSIKKIQFEYGLRVIARSRQLVTARGHSRFQLQLPFLS